jgi:hypothetical protein
MLRNAGFEIEVKLVADLDDSALVLGDVSNT